MTALAAIKKTLMANVGSHGLSEVWTDFCQMSALAIRNSVDMAGRDKREERYLRTAGGYTAEELTRFAEAFAAVTVELEAEFSDVLGSLFMTLELGSDGMGQFFTPYGMSQLMAQLTLPQLAEECGEREFVTVSEPTVGAGGMVIAVAEALQGAGVNYQQKLHVTAQDLSATAVHMAYIQLSLLGIPAVVVHGNTLTLEQFDAWHTPMHILGGWSFKLRRARAEADALEVMAESPAEPAVEPADSWKSVFAEMSA